MDYIKEICQATVDIKNCINNNEYLCEKLNSVDKNLIRDYYRSDKSGVIIDIRKEVCKTLLLDDINVDNLNSIISKHKENDPQKLKTWTNPYRILHPLVNVTYAHLDKFIVDLCEKISNSIDVKYTISNFNGSQHQGNDKYWVAFYNKGYRSQSDGLQIFIDFFDGELNCGIYKHRDKSYLIERVKLESVDDIYKFIDDNKNFILNEVIDPGMTFIDAAKFILNEFGNKPMTSKEIWNEIEKRDLVRTGGKTPSASLSTVILNDCVDSPVKGNKSKNIFRIVGKDPMKYELNNYMPDNIKKIMVENGFITIDVLREIFIKNGLDYKI